MHGPSVTLLGSVWGAYVQGHVLTQSSRRHPQTEGAGRASEERAGRSAVAVRHVRRLVPPTISTALVLEEALPRRHNLPTFLHSWYLETRD